MTFAKLSQTRFFSVLLAVLVAFSLLFTACFAAEEESLVIKVDEILETEDGATVVLKIQNNTGSQVSFGWVNSCDILVTTDEGDFSCKPPMGSIKIGKSTTELELRDIEGEIERIEITELCLLSDDGLPNEELHEVVIYDKEEGIKSYEGEFSFFSSPQNIIFTVISIVPFVIAGAAIVVGIIVFLHVRKNRKAEEEFNFMFSGNGADQQAAMNLSSQAHEGAMRDHANFMQQTTHLHTQTHDQFVQQTMNPTDMGGFNPPPTPPAGM